MDDTLHSLQEALDNFHAKKDVFIKFDCHKHFNIPKLHLLKHYIATIKGLGSLDGLNSENSEQLHINYTKKVYIASNHKDYTIQMIRLLQHQEAFIHFKTFLAWQVTATHNDNGPDINCCPCSSACHLGVHYHISH